MEARDMSDARVSDAGMNKGDRAYRERLMAWNRGEPAFPEWDDPDNPVLAAPRRPKKLASIRLFLSEDGNVGFAVTLDSDLRDVFSNPGAPDGSGAEAVRYAVEEIGARTLDCFDLVLPLIYQRAGFKAVGWMKWSEAHAPENWNYERYGRPNIVFMAVMPDDVGAREFSSLRPMEEG
jgi:hypothetical protein